METLGRWTTSVGMRDACGQGGRLLNFLQDPLIRIVGRDDTVASLNLPGVLATAMRDEIATFPALRAHQRHAWHAFLSQLGALALLATGQTAPPEDQDVWRDALRALTPDYPDDAPWHLVTPPEQPALLQPPLPNGGLAALNKHATTPDQIDILITATNHVLKQAVMAEAEPDDWAFALITLQTMQGYHGPTNYGISRMDGGYDTRPALGIAPRGELGAHLRRDILRLLALRNRIVVDGGYSSSGGLALVWLQPWDGITPLHPDQLDPYYIEICRRVRLIKDGSRLRALSCGSQDRRIVKAPGGVTYDSWAPLVIDKQGTPKLFRPDGRGFGYGRMVDLMFPVSNAGSPMQCPVPTDPEDGLALLARALVRGQGNSAKSDGYHERRVLISRKIRNRMVSQATEALAQAAQQRVNLAGIMSKVLQAALIVLLENGTDDATGRNKPNDKAHKDALRRARAFLDGFELNVDRDFFPELWRELEEDDPEAGNARRTAWVRELFGRAKEILDHADRQASKSSRRHYRARVRARDTLYKLAHGNKELRGYFAGETHAAD